MAFSHIWVGLFVDDFAYARLAPAFARADAMAARSLEWARARDLVHDVSPELDQTTFLDEARAAKANAFISSFNLPGYDELAIDLLTTEGALAAFASDENIFSFVIADRTTPASVIWRALGPERAARLPGRLGNVFLGRDEVAAALRATRSAFAGTTRRALMETARRYCGWSVSDDAIKEILDFLPEGLATAKARGRGFLALARPQI